MLVVVAGPSGCGKSTVSLQLEKRLHCKFVDGDVLHPPENIEKMRNCIPLTDEDRWPWLRKVCDVGNDTATPLAIVACSALAKRYRDYIREHSKVSVFFIFINVDANELHRRLQVRKNHFMKAHMLPSQIGVMEVPVPAEEPDCIVYENIVDIDDCIAQIKKRETE